MSFLCFTTYKRWNTAILLPTKGVFLLIHLLQEYVLCLWEQICSCVLSFLWNYSILYQRIAAQQVAALSVCEYGTEYTLSHTNLSWQNFYCSSTNWYCQLLVSFPGWRYVSGTIILRRSHGYLHLTSRSYDFYTPPQVFCQISVPDSKRSKLLFAHLIGFFVDLFWKKHMNIICFSLSPYLWVWRSISVLQVAFDCLANHSVQTSNPPLR